MKLPPPTLLAFIIPLLLVIGKYEPVELYAKEYNKPVKVKIICDSIQLDLIKMLKK
jgi:hypothetical protein